MHDFRRFGDLRKGITEIAATDVAADRVGKEKIALQDDENLLTE